MFSVAAQVVWTRLNGRAARFAALCLVVGCAEAGFAADASLEGDAGEDIDVEGSDDSGAGRGSDVTTDASATPVCPGGAGCPCTEAAGCDNGLCIETPTGKFCAKPCTTSCAVGYKCATVPSGNDIVTICVPSWGRLCEPCEVSKSCEEALAVSGALCVAYGGQNGSFCGAPCAATSECPIGYSCSMQTSTDGKTGKQCSRNPDGVGVVQCPCSARAANFGLQTKCMVQGATFSCPGTRTCSSAGLGACTAPTAAAEVCDGLDNDCNGMTDDGLCGDNDKCTDDSCDPKTAACGHAPNTGVCDDSSACTVGDVCKEGKCSGTLKDCDDKNPCTEDACGPATGCVNTPHNKPCSDFNACTANDLCDGKGGCVGQALDVSTACDDQNPCTAETCDPASAAGTPGKLNGCKNPGKPGVCEDGNPCTNGDVCSGGTCQPGSNVCSCTTNAECALKEDGDLCNGTLYCDKSKAPFVCSVDPMTTVACSGTSDTACQKAKCAPATGKCGLTSEPDAKPCDADGSVCTQGDACKGGVCTNGAVVNCDDKNPCTDNPCDFKAGCKQVHNVASCSDDNACTTGDTCASGQCVPGKKADCDDGSPCTFDGCSKATGKCIHDGTGFEGDACDADASVCSVGDTCVAGKCTAGKAKLCDDGAVCTMDVCDPAKGCVFQNTLGTCDFDGNPCTPLDYCKNGACTLGPNKICDDKNTCTADSCDPTTGACQNIGVLFDNAACEDGDLCTKSDTCKAGKCLAGVVVGCDDKNECTKDGCEPSKGCTHVKLADKTACSDGDACSINDACLGGNCTATKLDCDDKNPCTVDQCGVKGCEVLNIKDGSNPPTGPCAVGKYCVQGKCVVPGCGDGFPGLGETCDDGNAAACDGCEGCKTYAAWTLDGKAFGVAKAEAGAPGSLKGAFALENDLTLEAWVKPAAFANDMVVMSKSKLADTAPSGWTVFLMSGSGKLGFHHKSLDGGELTESASAVVAKVWSHAAITVVGDTVRFFVNGKPAGTSKLLKQRMDPTGIAVAVGRRYVDAESAGFIGSLDEVHVAAEALYGNAFVPARRRQAVPGTRALWRFDEGAGSVAKDSGPHGNELVLSGGAYAKDDCFGAAPDAAVCGDGKLAAAYEACDDANGKACDGCEDCRKQQHLAPAAKGHIQVADIASVAPDAFCPTCEMTIEAWVRPDQTGIVGEIAGTSCGYLSLNMVGGKFNVYRYPEPLCVSTTVATPGKWFHVAASMGWSKGSTFRLWIDGKLECSKTTKDTLPDIGKEVLFLGAGGGGAGGGCVGAGDQPKPGNVWPGAIDDVRLSVGQRWFEDFVPPRRASLDAQTRGLWRFDDALDGNSNEVVTGTHKLVGAGQEADKCFGELATAVQCGDGEKARWEACDSGASGGPPPKKCSTVCTLNPEVDCTSISFSDAQFPTAKNAMQYPVLGWTLEGWTRLKAPPTGAYGAIAGVDSTSVCGPMPKDQQWRVATLADGTDASALGGPSAILSKPKRVWKFGVWQHFALQYNGLGTGSLWVDGWKVRDFGNVPTTWVAACPMHLGASYTAAATPNSVAAQVSGLRLSKVVRYGQPFAPAWSLKPDVPTVFDWDFQEGTGANAMDLVFQYVMDLKGAAWTATGPGCPQ
ncbi:MAG: LamG domain-containing protein [Myxococcales bacterium]|nr:LamG domain-containing protein [Myxococcales bacterium]